MLRNRRLILVLGCLVLSAVFLINAGSAAETKTPEKVGFLPAVAEGKSWKLIWSDEFNGTKIDTSKWNVLGDSKRDKDYWAKEDSYLDGKGNLILRIKKDGERYTSGAVDSRAKFKHRFGYWVCRCKLPEEVGHRPAFWLYPEAEIIGYYEGRDGTEINLFEKPWADDKITQNLRWDEREHAKNDCNIPGLGEGFHTFGLHWTLDEYVFYVDGKETWRTNAGGVSQVREFIRLAEEIDARAGDITKANLPDYFMVDYVRVYNALEHDAMGKLWPSEVPADCPFEKSDELVGIAFTGAFTDHYIADTWYPSWASDGNLYSPWTDGICPVSDGERDGSNSNGYASGPSDDGSVKLIKATTGQAVLIGDDPLDLKVVSLGTEFGNPYPYGGRYPCGSLVYNGVWYYGTYCLGPYAHTQYGDIDYTFPWLGPLVGFRVSTDFGKTWVDTKHTPAKPLFDESGMWGYPVKIGAPHFVDFGKNMEHSPDGKAYLVGHGAVEPDVKPRFANLSWISGDQIYLIRVVPSIENINDASKYEFFGGYDGSGKAVWTRDFAKIMPLLEWNNNMGCVTVTYNAPLKKYLMCVTDGWPTVEKMNSYILEADAITGPWRLVSYMKDFGEQAYFLNFPSKFISEDGRTAWLCYSGNYRKSWKDMPINEEPPGSHYGLVLQEVKLLDKKMHGELSGK